MESTKSDQDYLERILILQEKKGDVRAIDIAHESGYSKPSVSIAMKKLKELEYIEVEDNRITLTETGRAIATEVYSRHRLFTDVLMELGVDKEIAAADACLIEHVMSEESVAAIRKRWKDCKKAKEDAAESRQASGDELR